MSKMISDLTPKEIKSKFLRTNPTYSEIEDNNHAIGDFFSIDDDEDEVWLMQCPKGSHISLLKDQKIKLPGRSNQNEFETIATEYSEPVPHAFGHKNKKGHNSVKIVPVRGSIILRNRLKVSQLPDAYASDVSSFKVPMPVGIKQRHPLHGVDFPSKLLICPQIAERLKHIDEAPTQKQTSKRKSTTKSNTVAIDSDSDVELVLQKKHKQKKKKRKHSSGDDNDNNEVSKKKKKGKKNSQIMDKGEELEWIQRLRE